METASDRAPAVDATLTPGADKNLSIEQRRVLVAELYPLGHTDRELAARFGVSHRAIERDRAAMNVPGRRRGPQISELEHARIARRRRRVRERYDAGEASAAIAEAECVSLYTIWRDLQATGPLRSAGQQTLYPELVGPRTCEYCGAEFQAKPSRIARGYGETCSHSCKMRRRWRIGRGIASEMVATFPGRARQRWLGRWSGALGGRPTAAEADPTHAAKVAAAIELHARNPRLGGREIAKRVELSHWQVRRLLAESTGS